jgi:hypothetical protein
MAFEPEKFPWTDRVRRMSDALGKLEGIAFGRWLTFSAFGYGDQLSINIQDNGQIEGFKELPGLREFAADLNTAMRPVIDNYTKQLRQEIANESVKIASRALSIG